MPLPNFFDISEPATKEDLESFESTIGKRLPDDFREFLLAFNGAAPAPNLFQLDEYEEDLDCLCIFGLNDKNDLRHFLTEHKERLGDEMLPVACDSFGNLICLSLASKDFGSVYFADLRQTRQKEFGNEPAYIAGSFEEFLHQLKDNESDFGNQFERAFTSELSSSAEIEEEVARIFAERDLDALEALLDAGFDIETIDDNYLTMLENAASLGDLPMVSLLTSRGAKIESSISIAEDALQFNYPDADHKGIIAHLKQYQSSLEN
ncbi:MAG: ankyrin repeat domain-containing protein [Candidatus Melainabacteria bacterium]|nr:ankyrin repeat domain-containing protein [Candidatus Melainabacteria bacterium]